MEQSANPIRRGPLRADRVDRPGRVDRVERDLPRVRRAGEAPGRARAVDAAVAAADHDRIRDRTAQCRVVPARHHGQGYQHAGERARAGRALRAGKAACPRRPSCPARAADARRPGDAARPGGAAQPGRPASTGWAWSTPGASRATLCPLGLWHRTPGCASCQSRRVHALSEPALNLGRETLPARPLASTSWPLPHQSSTSPT